MAKLLTEEPPSRDRAPAPPPVYHIGADSFRNSAARFWFGLIDELSEDFPSCDAVRMNALSGDRLRRDQLRPQAGLERCLEQPPEEDLEVTMRRVAAELDLFGPPGSVSIELMEGDACSRQQVLPLECVDTEILPYLLAWLLEWAGLDESNWNDELVGGTVDAMEPAHARAYRVSFSLENRHVSEGLVRRRLSFEFSRTP